MPLYRFVPVADSDDRAIYIQNPWWIVLFKLERWSFVSTLKAALYAMDWGLIEDSEKMQKKLAMRKELAEIINREIADANKFRCDRIGRSEPFELTAKEARERIKPPTDRPDLERLTSFLHPNMVRQYALSGKYKNAAHPETRKAGPQNHGPITPGMPGAATGYTLQEFANRGLHHIAEQTGVDQAVPFREEKQGEAGDRKARLKKLRQEFPQMPGENQSAWDQRLNALMKEQDQ